MAVSTLEHGDTVKVQDVLTEYNLKPIESYTQYVQGLGEVTVTYNFHKKIIETQKGDQIIESVTFDDFAKEINSLYQQYQASNNRDASRVVAYSWKGTLCKTLVGALGAGHNSAWTAALALSAANPAIAILIAAGNGAFFAWLSTNCKG